MIKYDVVDANGLEVFIDTVNEHIKDGWYPIGGMSAWFDASFTMTKYFQAMMKYDVPEPPSRDEHMQPIKEERDE